MILYVEVAFQLIRLQLILFHFFHSEMSERKLVSLFPVNQLTLLSQGLAHLTGIELQLLTRQIRGNNLEWRDRTLFEGNGARGVRYIFHGRRSIVYQARNVIKWAGVTIYGENHVCEALIEVGPLLGLRPNDKHLVNIAAPPSLLRVGSCICDRASIVTVLQVAATPRVFNVPAVLEVATVERHCVLVLVPGGCLSG